MFAQQHCCPVSVQVSRPRPVTQEFPLPAALGFQASSRRQSSRQAVRKRIRQGRSSRKQVSDTAGLPGSRNWVADIAPCKPSNPRVTGMSGPVAVTRLLTSSGSFAGPKQGGQNQKHQAEIVSLDDLAQTAGPGFSHHLNRIILVHRCFFWLRGKCSSLVGAKTSRSNARKFANHRHVAANRPLKSRDLERPCKVAHLQRGYLIQSSVTPSFVAARSGSARNAGTASNNSSTTGLKTVKSSPGTKSLIAPSFLRSAKDFRKP